MHYMNHLWTVPTMRGLGVGCHCSGMLPKSRLTRSEPAPPIVLLSLTKRSSWWNIRRKLQRTYYVSDSSPALFLGLCLQHVPGRQGSLSRFHPLCLGHPRWLFPRSLYIPCSTRACSRLTLLHTRPRTQLMVVWALFYFIFWPHDIQDLSFPTRDWTCVPCSGSRCFTGTFIDIFILWYCYKKCFITKKISRQAMETVRTVPHQDDSYARVSACTNSKQRLRPGLGAPTLGTQRLLLPERQDWHSYSDMKWSQKTDHLHSTSHKIWD